MQAGFQPKNWEANRERYGQLMKCPDSSADSVNYNVPDIKFQEKKG